MQAKLAQIVESNDLTQHEIQRIAEMANRDVQLSLYKTSSDKRFKFELANPGPLKSSAKKKKANFSRAATETEKVASAVLAENFDVPYRESSLSIYEQPLDESYVAELKVAELQGLQHELNKTRQEFTVLLKQGEAEIIKIASKAEASYSNLIQTGLDHMMNGITFTSLYQAIYASVGGGGATLADRVKADELALLLLAGLKKRGYPNHKLGFRHRGNIKALDALKPVEILALSKLALGIETPSDLSMGATKQADYAEKLTVGSADSNIPFLAQEAETWMKFRPSEIEHSCPQAYVDDSINNNLPNGKPVVFNTDNTFIVSIKDLMGDQSRMVRLHGAQEYIGLKLKQIEDALVNLKTAEKTAAEKTARSAKPKQSAQPAKSSPNVIQFPSPTGETTPGKPAKQPKGSGAQRTRRTASSGKPGWFGGLARDIAKNPFESAVGIGVPLATAGIGVYQQHMANKADKEHQARQHAFERTMGTQPTQHTQPAQPTQPEQPEAPAAPRSGGLM
jgi:hypothetical protein